MLAVIAWSTACLQTERRLKPANAPSCMVVQGVTTPKHEAAVLLSRLAACLKAMPLLCDHAQKLDSEQQGSCMCDPNVFVKSSSMLCSCDMVDCHHDRSMGELIDCAMDAKACASLS